MAGCRRCVCGSQTTIDAATTSAAAAVTLAEKSIRVADGVGRLAKGGQRRLDREARKEYERQMREARNMASATGKMATGTVSRLREMPTSLADAGACALSFHPLSLRWHCLRCTVKATECNGVHCQPVSDAAGP